MGKGVASKASAMSMQVLTKGTRSTSVSKASTWNQGCSEQRVGNMTWRHLQHCIMQWVAKFDSLDPRCRVFSYPATCNRHQQVLGHKLWVTRSLLPVIANTGVSEQQGGVISDARSLRWWAVRLLLMWQGANLECALQQDMDGPGEAQLASVEC